MKPPAAISKLWLLRMLWLQRRETDALRAKLEAAQRNEQMPLTEAK